jgi:hypothetical protein
LVGQIHLQQRCSRPNAPWQTPAPVAATRPESRCGWIPRAVPNTPRGLGAPQTQPRCREPWILLPVPVAPLLQPSQQHWPCRPPPASNAQQSVRRHDPATCALATVVGSVTCRLFWSDTIRPSSFSDSISNSRRARSASAILASSASCISLQGKGFVIQDSRPGSISK